MRQELSERISRVMGRKPIKKLSKNGVAMSGCRASKIRGSSALIVALMCVLWSGVAMAQSDSDFQVEQFEPVAAQGMNTLGINHSRVLPHLTPSAGLFLHFVDDPIQVIPVGGNVDDTGGARLIDDQLKAELLGSLGLFGLIELGVAVPVVLYQSGDTAPAAGFTEAVSAFAVGDIRVTPKVQIIDPTAEWSKGFGLGFSLPLYIPTGSSNSFQSDKAFRLEPRLALDWRHDSGFLIGANLGYQLLRPNRTAANFVSGDTFRWGLGSQIPVAEKVKILATLFGNVVTEDANVPTGVSADDAERGTPMEGQLGVQIQMPANLVAQVGAGAGLTSSVGSPDFRVFAGLSYTPMDDDTDKDGIKNSVDKCPTDPEDKDGFEDEDGCPDLDHDGDGILEPIDQCPEEPEDKDGFQDEDGCPDPDNDNDGLIDHPEMKDKCPDDPEDKDGFEDEDGCPDLDNDKDGIPDKEDKCPLEPEDKDGFQDEDGCPDPDNDGDSILDKDDKCPNEAGVLAEQGCPIKDRDKDGIPDKEDKCPDKPETFNGIKDEDGCPDGDETVVITETEIKILQKVFFDTNKSTIKKQSFKLLDTVANVLNRNPQVTKIRVEGHTDDVGKDEDNLDLSKRRAKAVRDYLTEQGVAASRLDSEGFGEEKPLCKDMPELNKDKKTARKNKKQIKACREDNRRVEFRIVEVNGKKVEATDSVTIEKKVKVNE